MLEQLTIKDFALIDRLTVEFDEGLNILTGETGAGKSIIVGALSFLLGGKADVDSIRTGSEETVVSAIVGVDPANADAKEWLAAKEIVPEDGRVVLRRSLKRSGRTGAFVQDAAVSRAELAEFTSFLFDIHGQHEHQALLKPESHRRYLDRFAGLEKDVQAFSGVFLELAEAKRQLEASVEAERNKGARSEMLAYAVEEIAKAAVKPGERAALEAEAKRLGEFEKLASYVNGAAALLFEEEGAALHALRKAKSQIEAAAAIDAELDPLSRRITDLFYEAEDALDQLRTYREGLRYDPERLETIEERLAALFKLIKKYGGDEEAVIAYRESAEAELAALERGEEDRAALEKRISELGRDVAQRATSISDRRAQAAVALSSRITAVLSTLGMPKARFSVQVASKGSGAGGRVCGQYGADDVLFLISANQGEPLKEMSKIASGGELSRVMLAVKTVLAKADTVETLVFDEIDTGIGGEVALAVAEHLSGLGASKQIFCITHLASIAAHADNHMKVSKGAEGDRTVTGVSKVSGDARRAEIARMLAGDAAGDAALAHAEELMTRYSGRAE